jgi:hypothetical protein
MLVKKKWSLRLLALKTSTPIKDVVNKVLIECFWLVSAWIDMEPDGVI